MFQSIGVLLVLLFLTSFSPSSPFQTPTSVLPTYSSLNFSSSTSSQPTPFCVPLPASSSALSSALSSAPSAKPSYWEMHARSTIGRVLGWFRAICSALLVVVFPCLAQWRMAELHESLKDAELPNTTRERRLKMLREHYELLDRGVVAWLWHQLRCAMSIFRRCLSWPFNTIWDVIRGASCVVCLVCFVLNEWNRNWAFRAGAGRSIRRRSQAPLADSEYPMPNYVGN